MIRRSGLPATAVWLAPPLAAGAALRLWNLAPQVLGGDEIYAVRTALLERLPAILTTYAAADPCIPLAALDRALLAAGVPLSEPVLRAPAFLCGLAFLLAAPLAVRRRLGTGAAAWLAWLAALSPVLVLYSRIARPYMPVVLCGSAAAAAFLAWWERPRPALAAAFVLAAALAVWLHLVAAPFVAAPFLFAAGDLAWRAWRARHADGAEARRDLPSRARSLLALALALALACAAFLVPARRSLWTLVVHKRRRVPVPWATIGEVLRLDAGTASPAVAALFWLAAAAGLVLLWRGGQRRLAAYTATLAGGQVAGLAILAPIGLHISMIADRYLILVLPLALLWVAVALAAIPRLAALSGLGPAGRAGKGARLPGALAGALFVAGLTAAGPFADPRFRASSFMHHNDFVTFTAGRDRLPAVSPFYRWLARVPPSGGAIVEFPWVPLWTNSSVFYIDQEVHGRRVLVASPLHRLYSPGLALHNLVAPSPEGLCASGARFVSVHRHIAREQDLVEPAELWMVEPIEPALRRALRSAGEALAGRLAAAWGPPVYRDAAIAVWDLGKLCGEARPRREAP